MTTTQQAPKLLTQECLDGARKALYAVPKEHWKQAHFDLELVLEHINALRQPQAARLTEEDRNLLNNCHAIVETPLQGIGGAALKKLLDIIDRLTAAPAQVTREEIEGTVRGLASNHLDDEITEWLAIKTADAIVALLKERGLVKEG